MRVYYISDGEQGSYMDLYRLLQNFRQSGVEGEIINRVKHDLYEGRGFSSGVHDCGQFVVVACNHKEKADG